MDTYEDEERDNNINCITMLFYDLDGDSYTELISYLDSKGIDYVECDS